MSIAEALSKALGGSPVAEIKVDKPKKNFAKKFWKKNRKPLHELGLRTIEGATHAARNLTTIHRKKDPDAKKITPRALCQSVVKKATEVFVTSVVSKDGTKLAFNEIDEENRIADGLVIGDDESPFSVTLEPDEWATLINLAVCGNRLIDVVGEIEAEERYGPDGGLRGVLSGVLDDLLAKIKEKKERDQAPADADATAPSEASA